jgi:hypothetical protein
MIPIHHPSISQYFQKKINIKSINHHEITMEVPFSPTKPIHNPIRNPMEKSQKQIPIYHNHSQLIFRCTQDLNSWLLPRPWRSFGPRGAELGELWDLSMGFHWVKSWDFWLEIPGENGDLPRENGDLTRENGD